MRCFNPLTQIESGDSTPSTGKTVEDGVTLPLNNGIMNKKIKTVKQLISSFCQTVYDKNGRKHTTRVMWVDELPGEETLWEADAPEDYRGYRNMEQSSVCEHINSHMAVLRNTYNAGPWGYLHYVAVLYIKRTVWKEFHINPFNILEANLRASDMSKGFSLYQGNAHITTVKDVEQAKKCAKYFGGSRIVLEV